jgi:ribokinase
MADLTRWDVVVVGGANTDYLIRGERLPEPGQTIEGRDFQKAVGGKGVNQAIAASRMGARVAFVGRVGNDGRGEEIIDGLDRDGVDTSFIAATDHRPTGAALVMVGENGEKQILTAPGANHDMRQSDVERAAAVIRSAKVVVTQLEIPTRIAESVLRIAHEANVTTVLDPAPAKPLPRRILNTVDIIRPNRDEAQSLTGQRIRGRNSAQRAARILLKQGAGAAIVHAGHEGNLLLTPELEHWLPHVTVPVVDSTGAGDAFVGALAAQLAEGDDLVTAAIIANAASALATTRVGAIAGLPTWEEVEQLLKSSRAA